MRIEKPIHAEGAKNHSFLDDVQNWRRILALFLALSPAMGCKTKSINNNPGTDAGISDSQPELVQKCEDDNGNCGKMPGYPGLNFVTFFR